MLLLLTSFTMLTSALLLSWIQPLCAKAILPNYGGVPMVWNTCMVFFQSMVLCGYLYVHILGKKLNAKKQAILHLSIAMVCFAFLPILWQKVPEPSTQLPVFTLLMTLMVKLALPVFLCASTSPLLQNWLSNSSHAHAKDPYFLYSASNIGSILALVSFPFFLEPWFGLQQQSWMWSAVFMIYVSLLALSAMLIPHHAQTEQVSTSKLSWQQKGRWVMLTMVPSSLFLAVTQHITTDLPSLPFLWLMPLFIYFLTFVITFAKKPFPSHDWMIRHFVFFLIFSSILLAAPHSHPGIIETLTYHFVCLFGACMICHGELVASRPDTSKLTEFYCWLALGGLLGGLLNTFIAPTIFSGIYEFPLALLASILLWPSKQSWRDWNWKDSVFILVLGIILFLFLDEFKEVSFSHTPNKIAVGYFCLLAMTFYYSSNRAVLACALSLFFIVGITSQNSATRIQLVQMRNFFGVKRVLYDKPTESHLLLNGSTLHGIQYIGHSGLTDNTTSYYRPPSQVATLMETLRQNPNIGIIGLGAGTMVCQFQHSQTTVFEIDPVVIKIAENPEYFTFLRDCPQHKIIVGDARLELAKVKSHSFDAIFVDAFSSDSIPIHLITQEAIELYKEKLTENGVIAFHISQRHLDLRPIMRSTADALHMQAILLHAQGQSILETASEWILFTNDQALLEALQQQYQWIPFPMDEKQIVWTDDYANLFSVLRW